MKKRKKDEKGIIKHKQLPEHSMGLCFFAKKVFPTRKNALELDLIIAHHQAKKMSRTLCVFFSLSKKCRHCPSLNLGGHFLQTQTGESPLHSTASLGFLTNSYSFYVLVS